MYSEQENGTCHASELDSSHFIPQDDDWAVLKSREVEMVKRILVQHIGALKDISVEAHIPHAYSAQMRKKSRVVSLGVLDADPSSDEGTQKIMDHLHTFVPQEEQRVIPILINGDGLSVDRMYSAKQRRCRAPTPQSRLDGLIPSPQEFHLEALLLQVCDELLCCSITLLCFPNTTNIGASFHKAHHRLNEFILIMQPKPKVIDQ